MEYPMITTNEFEYPFDITFCNGYKEVTKRFTMVLMCVSPSYPGHFNPLTGAGDPPEGPEFDYLTTYVDRVDGKGCDAWSWQQMVYFFGEEFVQKMFEEACEAGAVSGEY